MFGIECHLKLLIVCMKILSVLMMDFVFYLLFLMIFNNGLFGFISFLLFLVVGSFFYLMDYVRKVG